MEKVRNINLFFIEDPVSINFLIPYSSNFKKNFIVSCNKYSFFKDISEKIKVIKDIKHIEKYIIDKNITNIFLCSAESKYSFSKQLLLFSKKHNINTTLIIDSKDNIKKRIFNKKKFLNPDKIIVPDNKTKKDYDFLGFKNVKVINFINQLYLKKKIKILKKRKLNKKIITFCTVPRIININKNSLLSGYDVKIKDKIDAAIQEFIISLCENNKDLKFYKILRYHPKNNENDFEKYHWFFDEISIKNDPVKILNDSDYIFGETTSFLTDGALVNKRVYSILPIPERQNVINYRLLKKKINFIKSKKELNKIIKCI